MQYVRVARLGGPYDQPSDGLGRDPIDTALP